MKTVKKLIEVALPLEAINTASAREKSIRHGHPSTLHLWWARRPLAAARAVIFAQMVDDPSSRPELFPSEADQLQERERLFDIIRDLVKWENTNNQEVLERARQAIWESWRRTCADNAHHPQAGELFNPNQLPAFHDPFAGGGALPLEAQRLGLESYASDLNPVAVLINKAMIEIPPKFAGRAPVNPSYQAKARPSDRWAGAKGLAEDVRYYGQWMRDEAEKRIGHLYPKIEVTPQMAVERPDLKPLVGQKLTVIAWLWARTVKSPNPAFSHVDVPLASTFMLSSKAGKEAYVEPIVEGGQYKFTVRVGKPKDSLLASHGTKVGRGGNFHCLLSGAPIPVATIRRQGQAGTLGARMLAIVAEGKTGRVYLSPTKEHETTASTAQPSWAPDTEINHNPRDIRTQLYGLTKYSDLFTPRQLVALTTFSDLVGEAIQQVRSDAVNAGVPDDPTTLRDGGTGATAYAEAVGVYLGLAVDKCCDYWSAICSWHNSREIMRNTFGRQALPMVWDYAEANPMCDSSGNWTAMVNWTWKAIETVPGVPRGSARQNDAQTQALSLDKLVSTDPPYYDNIGYADLSDFFYVWLRGSLRPIFPDLFATLTVPKTEELVATPYRHGSREVAESFFLNGMKQALGNLARQSHPAFPITIYYAFKQAEAHESGGVSSTGWETFLQAVIEAGLGVVGTWPIRTELGNRMIASGSNALASSIVLVCNKRLPNARAVTRREFLQSLRQELPAAVAHLQEGNIAPVDLAQAAIGPGMAVYTRYSKVLDAQGSPVPVRDALALINEVLDETLAEQEGDFDSDTRFALAWFEQNGFAEGEFGVAETLSKAKNTSVGGLASAGILESKRGRVRLLKPSELPPDWNPQSDTRFTHWESVHHLVRELEAGGEGAAADLMVQLGSRAATARELAYRLYAICERKKRAAEAFWYNALVQSWSEMAQLARDKSPSEKEPTQDELWGGN